MRIIFIVPGVDNTHYRNRVVEFIENGYNVVVYAFERRQYKSVVNLPYEVNILGTLKLGSYMSRVSLYLSTSRKLGRKYNEKEDIFYLCGLDVAMFFHYINPKFRYIYEECDLVHTNTGLRVPLEYIDKKIIKSSLLTVLSSEGFIDYHFNGKKPNNVCLVQNKLEKNVIECADIKQKVFNKNNISIGFVGAPRFNSIFHFIDVFCHRFPQHTFHIYGAPVPKQFEKLRKYKNCRFHGLFKNPTDLPVIYQTIDLVLSTYDTDLINVRYAEPNKLYESIFFETPIIVSSNTFLAKKVESLGIGYHIDAMNDSEIVDFINQLSSEEIDRKCAAAHSIDKRNTLNINTHLFKCLEYVLPVNEEHSL